jgi:hypothetical protein
MLSWFEKTYRSRAGLALTYINACLAPGMLLLFNAQTGSHP